MLRKKQHLIQAKETTTRNNAKVTVQYIQSQPERRIMVVRSPTSNHTRVNSTAEEFEVENVEYLEEAVNSEEFVEEQVGGMVKEEYEDSFYPNAIHCLLDLYKEKYDTVITETKCGQIKFHAQVWQDIAKEMQESYFEFEADPIQQKYASLRQQYFEVRTQEDIENFEYFEKLHEIYMDTNKEVILNGGTFKTDETQILYKDENLMQPPEPEQPQEEEECPDFKSEIIVHKEHEFINMVEKELQAIDEPLEEEKCHHKGVKIEINNCEKVSEQPKTTETETQRNLKRPLDEVESSPEEPPKQRSKQSECNERSPQTPPVHEDTSDPSYSEVMSLKQYNIEQERRHREQMDFLNKQFRQHQMTLDNLSYQLQELIKRLPAPL